VALPAYSCFDVATAAVGANVPVLFYDVDPETLTPDLEGIQRVLANGTGVVVITNLFGFPVDWDAIQGSCREAGATLVEDAAQGLGSSWAGKDAGTFGDLTVLSFGRGKGWTGGGGGALLVRQTGPQVREHLERIEFRASRGRGLKAMALASAQWGFGRPSLYGFPSLLPGLGLGQTLYRDPEPISAISSFSASLVAATAVLASEEIEARKRKAMELDQQFSEREVMECIRPIRPLPEGVSSYLRYPILIGPEAAATVDGPFAGSVGVVRGYPRTLPDLPALASLWIEEPPNLPGARLLSEQLVTLPTHSLVGEADLDVYAAKVFPSPLVGA
jgi:dTDP-4-amino-4,6-dideoxygalactose transaminase